MFKRPNPSAPIAVSVQIADQIRRAIETAALLPGDKLPTIKEMAEQLVVNPNTVAKVYHELQDQGVIDLRHGVGAFIRDGAQSSRAPDFLACAKELRSLLIRFRQRGLSDQEIRRLLDVELPSQFEPERVPR